MTPLTTRPAGQESIAELYRRVARSIELSATQHDNNVADDNNSETGEFRQQDLDRRQEEFRTRMAPLASLDCSITENTISASADAVGRESPAASSTNTVLNSTLDTPTLRGCFECDELSDMVNDSLFEITSTGCLSKSVFGPAIVRRESTGHDNDSQVDHEKAHESSQEAPAAQRDHELVKETGPKMRSAPKKQQATGKERASTGSGAAGSNGLKPRSKSARVASSSGSRPSASHDHHQTSSSRHKATSGAPPNDVAERRSILKDPKNNKTTRRQTRSNPDVRQNNDDVYEDDDYEDNVLGRQTLGEDENGICGTCSKKIETSKRRDRHRFTFSLFNLFTGSKADDHERCRCGQILDRDSSNIDRSQRPSSTSKKHRDHSNSSRSRNISDPCNRPYSTKEEASDGGGGGIHMKSRDSIKLTNQRKRRDRQQQQQQNQSCNNKPIRNSSSFNDFCNQPSKQQATELLLDFPVSRIQSASMTLGPPVRPPSLQSAIKHRERTPSAGGRLQQSSNQGRADVNQQTTNSRPLKSVKFAQPDSILDSHEKSSRSCLYILKSTQ